MRARSRRRAASVAACAVGGVLLVWVATLGTTGEHPWGLPVALAGALLLVAGIDGLKASR